METCFNIFIWITTVWFANLWAFFFFFHLRSLQRALDRRLYLLLYGKASGAPSDKPVWHFPEKVYETEETLRMVRVAIFFSCLFFLLCLSLFSFLFILTLTVCSVQRLHWNLWLETFPTHILLEMLRWVIWLYSQQRMSQTLHLLRYIFLILVLLCSDFCQNVYGSIMVAIHVTY